MVGNPPPPRPISRKDDMFQRELLPVTSTELSVPIFPITPCVLRTTAPLVTINWLTDPVSPMVSLPTLVQTEPPPVTNTVLLLAPIWLPTIPTPLLTELALLISR